ncbi:MAG TPA: type II toxin-antitoxin system HicB family antitoxin [Terriglobia bacterium]|nr:type II toxin-antitoxin system HicB family antitoxin [Terriglobia bacterium]
MKLTAIIESEGDGYVSLCPELDIASQEDSIEQARDNLREALELFFECASVHEVKERPLTATGKPDAWGRRLRL